MVIYSKCHPLSSFIKCQFLSPLYKMSVFLSHTSSPPILSLKRNPPARSPPILSHKETPPSSQFLSAVAGGGERRQWFEFHCFSRSESVFHRTTAFTSAASPILNQNTTITRIQV
ncbi:hypothetical protein HanRHA438_Chr17g0792451 [Helianthus annuus]|nr:hypothetical protein HanRHA438_Chr17g0792451 [Helianthus annuus]